MMSTETTKWIPEDQAESLIKEWGLTWEVREVRIKDIDVEKGWHNHARIKEPKQPQLIDQYGKGLLKNDRFPRPVLFDCGGALWPAGGNHRIGAAISVGFKSIDAYVVKTDNEKIIDQLPRQLNFVMGKGCDREEVMKAAVSAVGFGDAIKIAAMRYCISEDYLRKELINNRIKQRLKEFNIELPDKTSKTTTQRLNAFLDNDNVLRAVGSLIVDARLTEEQAVDLIKRVRAIRNESGRLALIDQERLRLNQKHKSHSNGESNGKAPSPSYKQSNHQRFSSLVTSFENLILAKDTLEKNGFYGEEKTNFCHRLLKLSKSIEKMARNGLANNEVHSGGRKASRVH